MIVKLLTENHLEFLSLKGGCRGSSNSTLVKMSNCGKSHVAAQLVIPWLFTCTGDTPLSEVHGLSPCRCGQTMVQILQNL